MNLADKGQFGDSFGVYTSLFSALGFSAVITTLWYQHLTIRDSNLRSELQQFESILFQLLSTHNTILSDIDVQKNEGGETIASGRDCFHRFYTRNLKPAYKRIKNQNKNLTEKQISCDAFDFLFTKQRHNLGHYFRLIYNIFLYIDSSSISKENKIKYSRIVRAQLSDYELLLLFYNCIHDNGVDHFKPLVEKYCLFNNLPQSLLIHHDHVKFYSEHAFNIKT